MLRRSIGFPLTLGSVLILLVIALAVGWLVLLMSDVGASRLNPGLTTLDWVLLILGTATCGVILIGLLMLGASVLAIGVRRLGGTRPS